MWRRNLKKPDIRWKTIWKTDQRRSEAPLVLSFAGADLGVRGRLTAPKFQKIVDGHGGDVVERFLRQKRLMRADDDVRHGDQPHERVVLDDGLRTVLIEKLGLLLVHIQTRRADLPAAEPLDERLCVHQRAAGRVDDHDAGLHAGDGRRVDHVPRLVGERAVERNDVRLPQKLRQLHIVKTAFRIREFIVCQHAHPEALADTGKNSSDLACADYADGLALKALKTIFEYLPRAYDNGQSDVLAREKMANAATMAGMAFANAFLGVCHSMAHKLGAFHHLPHGVANALMIDEVLRFNAAEVPAKMGTFPQYDHPHTLRRYAEVAEYLGIFGNTDEEKLENLIKAIDGLKERVGIKKTIKEYVPDEQDFLNRLDDMVEQAFDDQCTGANPRYPLMSEIKQMYLNAYYGNKHFTEEEKPTAADFEATDDKHDFKKAYRRAENGKSKE